MDCTVLQHSLTVHANHIYFMIASCDGNMLWIYVKARIKWWFSQEACDLLLKTDCATHLSVCAHTHMHAHTQTHLKWSTNVKGCSHAITFQDLTSSDVSVTPTQQVYGLQWHDTNTKFRISVMPLKVVDKYTENDYLTEQCTFCNERRSKTTQTPWPLVRERTIPTEGPPLVDEI
jgi:hypothetical protein